MMRGRSMRRGELWTPGGSPTDLRTDNEIISQIMYF